MICLSCTESTINADLEIINKNREYIDLIEVRADFLADEERSKLADLPGRAGLPCILTFRKPEDGGVDDSVGNEERAALLSAALSGGWKYIDIEDDADTEAERALMKTAEDAGVRIIRSFHDFNGVPENLAQRMLENSKGDRYIPKAAVMPRNTAELFAVIEAHRRLCEVRESSAGFSCISGPLLSDYILVGMGAAGFPTRVMAGAWGSMLTFCSAGSAKAAPGHVSPRDLVDIYNYPALTSDTRLLGIIGRPVMHSQSPKLHNAAIKKHGLDAVYLPFETDSPELLLERAGEINLGGLSVTIPHKQRVIGAAESVDSAVTAIGACNTLVRGTAGSAPGSEAGGWRGYNTDWVGFLQPLDELSGGAGIMELAGRRVLVIGAGGAARAVVHALVSRGAEVVIVNRTAGKAEALAADFGCRGGGMTLAAEGDFSLAVQTTSVGMSPDVEGNPVPGFDFSKVETAYDIIYTPEKTAFLSAAESAGCRIINGFPMLKAQAAEQFRLFTGCSME